MRRCPKCGSNDLRRSPRRRMLDHLLQRIGLFPYRCRNCRSRFYRSVEDMAYSADYPPPHREPRGAMPGTVM